MTNENRFCEMCGARIQPGDVFCVHCGAKLEVSSAAVPGEQTAGAADAPAWRPLPGEAGTPVRKFSSDAAGTPARKPSPKGIFALVAAVLVVALLFHSIVSDEKDRPSRSYAEAAERAVVQLEKYEEDINVSFDIPRFEEQLSSYEVSRIAMNFVSADVMARLYKAVCRYDGNPRHGERLGLTAYPNALSSSLSETGSGYSTLHLKIGMSYFTTAAQEDALQKRVGEVLARMNLTGRSDYEKVRAIYNYICENVTYDYVHLGNTKYLAQYTAYAALFDHTAVCSGVAELFYVMATAAGVEAHIKTSNDHAWNFVKLDGKYYYLDATWDLGVPEAQYRYFLKGEKDFVLDIREISHRNAVTFDLYGINNVLNDTDKGYNFSKYAYGL